MNLSLAATVMLLTNQLEESPSGGREMLCKLNHDVLIDKANSYPYPFPQS